MDHVVIVGASLAGIHSAQALRRNHYDGRLTVIGDEHHYPYDRPPLSKHYLAGAWEVEKLRLRPAADPDALGIEWRLGATATSLDVASRSLRIDDEGSVEFDGLIIATGAAPRRLPGAELDGVHVLRSLDDATALREAFDAEPARVVVIGAGFIGAEVAATARERGLDVTMIEAAEAPLMRVLDRSAGMAVAELHRSHGVDVRLGTGATIVGSDGVATGVELSDGTTIESTVIVLGIGVVPNVQWLEDSDLTIGNGVVCDARCLAAPGIVAAGDVACWPNGRFGGALTRVEQWDNAIEQGGYAARSLLAWAGGDDIDPYEPIPWFWSDQYDRKIQLAGIPSGRVEMIVGSMDEGRFAQIYIDDQDQFVGALAWNRPKQAIQARQLLAAAASVDEARATLTPAAT